MKQLENLPPEALSSAARLEGYLRQYEARYPQAWAAFDRFRQKRKEFGDWPDWCFCPLAGAIAIASHGAPHPSLAQITAAAQLAALAAWRPTLAVFATKMTAAPTDLTLDAAPLFQLPAWGVYLLTPQASFGGRPLHGLFAHLECDAHSRRPELRLVLDGTDADGTPILIPIPVHLDQPTLDAALHAVFNLAFLNATRVPSDKGGWEPVLGTLAGDEWRGVYAQTVAELAPLVAELSRLARAAATPNQKLRLRPRTRQTPRGEEIVPPPSPSFWEF